MSKKTFKTAPKPTPAKQPTLEEITTFEAGGVGHDDKSVNVGTRKPTLPQNHGQGSTKRLSVDLPAETHIRFKTACSATGTKMVAEIEQFIESRTAELEDQAGITRK